MWIDQLAIRGVHWTARTLVSLFDTSRRPRKTTGIRRIDFDGNTRERLEIASPQEELVGTDLDEEIMDVRAPDAELLATIAEEGVGR